MDSKQVSCCQFHTYDSHDKQLEGVKKSYFMKLNALYHNFRVRKNSNYSTKSNETDLTSSLISLKNCDRESACSTLASESGVDFMEKLAEKLNMLQETVGAYNTPPSSELSILAYEILGCKAVPSSDFSFYLNRINKYTGFEESLYVGATVLLKRIIDKLNGFDEKLIHKTFIGCLTIINKMYNEIDVVPIAELAKIFGIPLIQLQRIERFIMFYILDAKILVSESEYNQQRERILNNNFVSFMLNSHTS